MIERSAPKKPKDDESEGEERGRDGEGKRDRDRDRETEKRGERKREEASLVKKKMTEKKRKFLGYGTPTYMVHSPGLGPGTSPQNCVCPSKQSTRRIPSSIAAAAVPLEGCNWTLTRATAAARATCS